MAVLTSEQQIQFATWLERNGVVKECPACQQNNWKIGNFVELSLWQSDKIDIVIPVICGQCGLVRFFSAGIMGLDLNQNMRQ